MVTDQKIMLEFNIEGGNFTRAGFASSEIKKTLKKLDVDMGIIKRTVVASYEGEVNVVAHAYSGTMYAMIDNEAIQITIVDEGPGIPDIEAAMQEGFSTASVSVREMGFGAGMGLPNMKKNADRLEVSSEVGKGTKVVITMLINQ
jgi:serine/threonine-protein kinase RsbT